MRLSLFCVYLDGHVRRSVCNAIVPRETVRNTTYSKPRGVTVDLTNPSPTLHMKWYVMIGVEGMLRCFNKKRLLLNN